MSDAPIATGAADRPEIGFVGLGNMGLPMCRRLVDSGYNVTAFDIRSDALDGAVAAGARRGSSVAEVAGSVDLFLTSLPEPRHVDAVMRTTAHWRDCDQVPSGSTSRPIDASSWRPLLRRRRPVSRSSTARSPARSTEREPGG